VPTSFFQVYGNAVGLLYETKTASPYNVKFAFLTVVVPVVVAKPIIKMDLGPHPRSRLMFKRSLKYFFS
jgi:hypothetical protein